MTENLVYPNCFGNYNHKDFCFNAERQQKRQCKRQPECFEKAIDTHYFSKTPYKCEHCKRLTNFYEVEDISCSTFKMNLWIPDLSKVSNEYVAWLEHWVCPKHRREQKLIGILLGANKP